MVMRTLPTVLLGSFLLVALGCSGGYSSYVEQGKDEGYIRFENVTALQHIYLDGKIVGTGDSLGNLVPKYPFSDASNARDDYVEESPDRLLAVSPGTHLIEIVENDELILKQKLFIGTNSTKIISINMR